MPFSGSIPYSNTECQFWNFFICQRPVKPVRTHCNDCLFRMFFLLPIHNRTANGSNTGFKAKAAVQPIHIYLLRMINHNFKIIIFIPFSSRNNIESLICDKIQLRQHFLQGFWRLTTGFDIFSYISRCFLRCHLQCFHTIIILRCHHVFPWNWAKVVYQCQHYTGIFFHLLQSFLFLFPFHRILNDKLTIVRFFRCLHGNVICAKMITDTDCIC